MLTKESPPIQPIAARTPTGPAVRPRLVALDGLRLIAALMVVFHHFVGYGGGSGASDSAWGRSAAVVFPTASRVASYTWTGVEFFFIISGFVICMSSWGRSLGDFFKSRVIRLYPAYWLAVLATTATLTVWPLVRSPMGLRDVLLNLTMLQEPFKVGSVDAVYWTLWVEMRFYLLFALVVWKGLTYRRVVLFCVLWSVVSIMSTVGRAPFLDYLVMPEYSSYFIAGMAMYLMHRFRPNLILWGIVLLSWAFSARQVSIYSDSLAGSLGRTLPSGPAVALMTVAYVVMIALALGWFSWVRGRWLTTAGAVTYPLYLLHEFIGWTGIRLLRNHLSPWVLVATMTIGLLVAGWLVNKLVERPLSALMKQALGRAISEIRDADRKPAALEDPAGEQVPGRIPVPAHNG